MKVLLVQPPIEDFYDTSIRTYPLGLLYLAAKIAPLAEVSLLDARTTAKPTRLKGHNFPELDSFYRHGTYTPFSFFTYYNRFGLSAPEIRRAIEQQAPDLVGISSMCSTYAEQAFEIARIVKGLNRDIVTVVGGVHPTLFPEHVLSQHDVDFCIRGEGETPFFQLVTGLSAGRQDLDQVEGLCCKQGQNYHIGRINVEKEIDLLPERRLLDMDRYRINKKRYAFFLTSRGCPFSCGFCGKPPVPYRQRALTSVEKEIEVCTALGIEAIDFEDDMLNLDKSFFADMLAMFKGKGFTLSAMNGIYPGTMDVPTLRHMYDAGFRRLNFSLVDISDSVLKSQKRSSHASFLRILPYLEASPYLLEVHFIIGLPGQTPADLLATLRFLMERRLLLGPSIFYPAPGSRICQAAGDGEKQVAPEMVRSSLMLPWNPLFPRHVTYTFVKLVRFVNYVKRLADRQTGMTGLSDLLAPGDGTNRDRREQVILERLFAEKRFSAYDTARKTFIDEPQDFDLVRKFFTEAKGARIRGYRTDNSLEVDV